MINLVLSLKNPQASSLALSGGKGANLATMTQAGFPVPGGFVVTTLAFSQFLAIADRKTQLDRFLSKATRNSEDINRLSEEIREWICSFSLPPELEDELRQALIGFSEEDFFAVRSSATAEDLPYLSFAGQQDTYLNIRGLNSILDHIQRCWASLYTERALIYRSQNQIEHQNIRMAVVVQKMVFPTLSGILFTADPITNDHSVQVINASYGLGEALVSGLVNPDLIRLNKADDRILSYTTNEKKMMITAQPGGGTIQTVVPAELQIQKCLTNPQIQSLAELGKLVEQVYGTPQDIEWAIGDETLFLLQTRPITSLFPLPAPPHHDGNLHIFLSVGHPQMNTDAFSPLGLDIVSLLLPFGRPPLAAEYSPYVRYAGGRLYTDLNPLLANRLGRKALPRVLEFGEPVARTQILAFMQSDRFPELFRHPSRKMSISTVRDWLIPMLAGVVGLLLFRPLENLPERMQALNRASRDAFHSEVSSVPLPERLVLIKQKLGSLFKQKVIINAPPIAAPVFASHLLHRLFPTPDQHNLLQLISRGLSGNITTEMDMQVADLADIVAAEPELQIAIHKYLSDEITWSELESYQSPRFSQAWKTFMDSFGSRTPGELDVGKLRWQDDPRSLLRMILSNISTLTPRQAGLHRPHFSDMHAKNMQSQQLLLDSLNHSFLNRLKKPIARRLLAVFTHCAPCRENPKYLMIQIMYEVRKHLVEAGQLLVDRGQLSKAEDIFQLHYEELLAAFRGANLPLQTLVQQRNNEFAHFQKLSPPRVMLSSGEILREQLSTSGLPAGALAASAVSPGVVEGIVHVVLDPAREHLQQGEILVAPFTDPGWTPLFVNAAGLILETGGMMTHGSVVAREYGIPAVVGVVDATKCLQSGMRVRLNGDLGYVEILPSSADPLMENL